MPDTTPDSLPETALQAAAEHLQGLLRIAFEHGPGHRALVVFDLRSELSRALAQAYRRCLPAAAHLDFDSLEPAAIRGAFLELAPGSLVVLVQSGSFRLDAFRIRVELFKRGLKVIEHPHLERMVGPEALTYIAALAYDPGYYRRVGPALKAQIDRAQTAQLITPGGCLRYSAGLEPAKLNTGDYRDMANTGGQYPIGEVFTESRVLEAVEGRVQISHFGDTEFRVNCPPQPITLVVSGGAIQAVEGSTPEFERVLANIRAEEGQVLLRELGFGLNRAFSRTHTVSDIGTFERMCGVHLSLGKKHATYPKAGIDKQLARYHVDVFAWTERVLLDAAVVYQDGAWRV